MLSKQHYCVAQQYTLKRELNLQHTSEVAAITCSLLVVSMQCSESCQWILLNACSTKLLSIGLLGPTSQDDMLGC